MDNYGSQDDDDDEDSADDGENDDDDDDDDDEDDGDYGDSRGDSHELEMGQSAGHQQQNSMHYSHMAEQKHYEVASAGAQMYGKTGNVQGF